MKKFKKMFLLLNLLPIPLSAAAADPAGGSWLQRAAGGFVAMNKEAFRFASTTGLQYIKTHPVEAVGGLVFLAGLIVFLHGVVYQPSLKTAASAPEDLPAPKEEPEPEPEVEATIQTPQPKAAEPAKVDDYAINPLNVPHVEHTDAEELEIANRKRQREEDKAYFDSHADDEDLDKEDLEFFKSLSRDFDQIDEKLEK